MILNWDDTDPYRVNSAITNSVHAGIAASDAICCAALKRMAKGESHEEAIPLLESVQPDGRELGRALRRLLSMKNEAGYGAKPLPLPRASDAQRYAEQLLDGARTHLVPAVR